MKKFLFGIMVVALAVFASCSNSSGGGVGTPPKYTWMGGNSSDKNFPTLTFTLFAYENGTWEMTASYIPSGGGSRTFDTLGKGNWTEEDDKVTFTNEKWYQESAKLLVGVKIESVGSDKNKVIITYRANFANQENEEKTAELDILASN